MRVQHGFRFPKNNRPAENIHASVINLVQFRDRFRIMLK